MVTVGERFNLVDGFLSPDVDALRVGRRHSDLTRGHRREAGEEGAGPIDPSGESCPLPTSERSNRRQTGPRARQWALPGRCSRREQPWPWPNQPSSGARGRFGAMRAPMELNQQHERQRRPLSGLAVRSGPPQARPRRAVEACLPPRPVSQRSPSETLAAGSAGGAVGGASRARAAGRWPRHQPGL
jgi:hypothetical protein